MFRTLGIKKDSMPLRVHEKGVQFGGAVERVVQSWYQEFRIFTIRQEWVKSYNFNIDKMNCSTAPPGLTLAH